jgi:hypothetical protein
VKPKAKAKSPNTWQEDDKEVAEIKNKAIERTNAREPFDFSQCPETPGKGYHIVQPGDNLKAIARTYRINEQDLITWNKIKNPNLIEVCQKIWLTKPPKNNTTSKAPPTQAATYSNSGSNSAKKVQDQSDYWEENYDRPTRAAQYNAKTPEYNGPANKITKVAPAVAAVEPTTHRVKSGDYLYKIAKEYGCLEVCIRRANKMPLEGDITLWPGQELIIPECTCTLPSGVNLDVKSPGKGETRPTAKQPVQDEEYYNPQTSKPNFSPKTPNTDEYYKPQGYNTGTTGPKPEKIKPLNNYNEDRPANGNDEGDEDTYFTEHIVKVGDTLNSIGYRYRTNAAELAELNNLKPNDTLVAGTRLLIPHKK